MTEYGPQYSRDDALTARMRFHQSWYRVHRLHLLDHGTDARGNPYGNYLTADAAAEGRNFLTKEIFGVARTRMSAGGSVEQFRCTRNMLSSQPMAFNLFGPLCGNPELARVLLDPLLPGGVTDAKVEIEWAPERKLHLRDATSFDVVVWYTTRAGERALAAIETKLTEPFSQKRYDTDRYREVAQASAVWQHPAASELADIRWNQVWRNHLLVESIRQQPGNEDLLGYALVVHHPKDERCTLATGAYSELLDDRSSFRALDLAQIVERWRPILEHHDASPWLDDFEARYVDLDLSASAWDELHSAKRAAAAAPATAVTAGHERALALLQRTGDVQITLERYRSAAGTDVYLRPTNAGLVVLSLDWEGCRSMIGVGSRDGRDHVLTSLPPDPSAVESAVTGYVEKRDSLRRASAEEQFSLRCVDHALRHRLRLPTERDDLRFLHQEWRLPQLGRGVKIDLLAFDPSARQLVVIECKDSQQTATFGDGRPLAAAEQAQQYADVVWEHRDELYSFFERLGTALGAIYDASPLDGEFTLDPTLPPRTLIWWPGHPDVHFDD
jgi:hypothetical protein